MAYTLLNQLPGTEKEGELYLLEIGNYFVGISDRGTIDSYDTKFHYIHPSNAVVFKTKAEANSIIKIIHGVPIAAANIKLKPIKVKDICELGYVISANYEYSLLEVHRKWIIKDKPNRVFSDRDNQGEYHTFKSTEHKEYVNKFNELKSDMVNSIHQKLITINQLKP